MQHVEPAELMTQSLALLVKALSLLDQAGAPGEIGAHVDLARERLSRTLELSRVVNTTSRSAA
jgi:hypothetical protein